MMQQATLAPESVAEKCRVALQEFLDSETTSFPGAIGRGGTLLVRCGFARRLGLCTYADGGRNEGPDRWVRFELTPEGYTACKELGLITYRRRRV